jgi:hypothetical protein
MRFDHLASERLERVTGGIVSDPEAPMVPNNAGSGSLAGVLGAIGRGPRPTSPAGGPAPAQAATFLQARAMALSP